MKKVLPLLIALGLFAGKVSAQIYVEPVIGYQLDMNNNGFKLVSSAVQLALQKSRRYELIFLLQKSWPLAITSNDSAFTANSSLPVYTAAEKTILPGSFAVSIGHRFVLAGANGLNRFSLLVNTGLTAQKIKVRYRYDKSNYTILNPDQTQNRFSVFISGGVEYMRLLKSGRIFFQTVVSSPPAGKPIKYPSTFKFMAPLNFNIGYSILIKK
jgi:hypothetical protein